MRFHVLIGAVCLAIISLDSTVEGGIIIVGQGGAGDYETISEALVASASGDEIWVRGGRFHEAIKMKVGVALFGGFPASGTPEWEDRDWTANETIIDATGLNNSVVIGADEAILDGFTITSGEAHDGGGVLCVSYSPTLVNCTITGNTARYTGGGVSSYYCSPTLENCTITRNAAEEYGGGLSCWNSSPTLTNCTIMDNTAVPYGGGVCCRGSSPALTNCTIAGNVADLGGGVYCYDSFPTLTNCAITGNTTRWDGGGLFCFDGSSPALTNCTITGNTADDDGGGIYCGYSSSTFMVNCISWGNAPNEIGVSSGEPAMSFSCVAGGFPGAGNIDATPEFVRPWDGSSADLRLLPGSPCIDAGSNEAAAGILTDLDGNARIWDGDDVPGAVVDMGAYEFGAPFPADTNGDRRITGADLFTFSRWWEDERNTENSACDPTGDRSINREDLLWFLPHWRGRR